jgi:hypothetical protein
MKATSAVPDPESSRPARPRIPTNPPLIRTILVKDGVIYIQAGAGIVADSDPEREHLECVNKARAMVQAIRLAEAM